MLKCLYFIKSYIHKPIKNSPLINMRFPISFILFLWAMLFAFGLNAQNCGCAEAQNCPETIAVDTEVNICYDFTDAFNNNLASANQGVCGVSVHFTHDYIWDLELTLVSPAGQEVILVGSQTSGVGGTLFTSWDVNFVSCSETAQPSGTYAATWTNDQSWPFIGAIGGSYYPHLGCLEDFNAGPVNGQWCLRVNNLNSFEGGNLIDFQIDLCDESGVFCCDADGGDLDGSMTTCQGDEDLILSLEAEYVNNPPDINLYHYVYFISEMNGVLLDTASSPDLSTYPPGDYEVCGLSYDINEIAQIPSANGIVTMQEIKNDLNGLNPSFCGMLSHDCYPVTILSAIPVTNTADTICFGENYMIGDSTFTETGNYDVHFTSFFGCDSLVNLDLSVLTIDTAMIEETICIGESYSVGDSTFTTTGIYEVYRAGASRCDSLYLIDLTIVEPVSETVVANICEGESYNLGTNMYNISGTYTDTIPSVSTGCDSIVFLTLNVITVDAQVAQTSDTINCDNPIITIDGSGSSNDAGTVYEWSIIAADADALITPTNQNTVQVNNNGLFKFKVSRLGCADSTLVNILDLSNDFPLSEAGNGGELTCVQNSLILDGSASEQGANISYLWTTTDGSIAPNEETSLTPTITGAPAYYYLSVENDNTGCTAIDSVFVGTNTNLPSANAGNDTLLNCQVASILLDGTSSYVDDGYTYVWTDENDNVLPVVGTAQAIATTPGTYYFTVTEIATGCEVTDGMVIMEDLTMPTIAINGMYELTCQNIATALAAQVTTSTDYTVNWSGGNITSGANTLNPTVDATGWYYISVTDNRSQCSELDSILVNDATTLPNAEIGTDTIALTCSLLTTQLGDVNATSIGINFTQEWYLGGVSQSTNFPYEVNAAGEYILVVTNTNTGCVQTDTVTVISDMDLPFVEAGNDTLLTCQRESILLDGTSSYINTDYTYVWTDQNDDVLPVVGTAQATVNIPGTYYYTITETATGCAATDSLVISQDTLHPTIAIQGNYTLTCQNPELSLLAIVSNSTEYNVEWIGTSIIANGTTLTPLIDASGLYYLTVTDNNNQCAATDSVLVDQSIDLPQADAGSEEITLNCLTTTWALGDTNDTSMGAEYTREWFRNDTLLSTDFPYEVSTQGEYVLIVTNNTTGCTASDTINVIENRLQPIAYAGVDTELNCETPSIILDGEELGVLPNDDDLFIQYLWYDENDNLIQSGEDSLLVLNPGEYTLVLYEDITYCSDTATVTVTQDPIVPIAYAGADQMLDCLTSTALLDGTASSIGNFTYTWTTVNGGAINFPSSLTTVVNSVGSYILEVSSNTDNCVSLDQVEVTLDTTACAPIIDINGGIEIFSNNTTDGIIDCMTEDQAFIDGAGYFLDTLDASSSTPPSSNIVYNWEAITGYIYNESNPIYPIVTEGTYALHIVNILLNITVSDTVDVLNIRDFPNADAGQSTALTCNDLISGYTLDGTLSDQGTQYSYSWVTEDGGDFGSSDITTLNPTIYSAGTYELTVIDNSNGCLNTSAVLISPIGQYPTACIVDEMQMECEDITIAISDTCAINNPNFDYTWSVIENGNISGTNNAATIDVQTDTSEVSALFELVITNTQNQCFTRDTMRVFTAVNCYPECVVAPSTDIITCFNPSITLDAMGSSTGSEYLYSWENVLGGTQGICGSENTLNPCIDEEGIYILTVTNNNTGFSCQSTPVFVDAENAPPDVEIDTTVAYDLTCTNTIVNLTATSSDQTAYTFAWANMNNCIQSNNTLPSIEANCEGMYLLTVTDLQTGCQNTTSIQVDYDTIPPANIMLSPTNALIGCINPQIVLNGSGSSQGVYSWTKNGQILEGEDNLTYTADSPGDYCLIIINPNNGCSISSCATVLQDNDAVFADAGANQFITCTQSVVQLTGMMPSDPGYTFEWTTDAAMSNCFYPSTGDLTINASCAGTYTLTVTETATGCEGISEVEVIDLRATPNVDAGADQELSCSITEVEIGTENTDFGTEYSYNWNGPNFTVTSDPRIIIAQEAGTYNLAILNNQTGCFNVDQVEVTSSVYLPLVDAGVDTSYLTCANNQVALDGTNSAMNDSLSYWWTSNDGTGIITNPTQRQITVDEDGEYIFTITNDITSCVNSDTVWVVMDTLNPQLIIIGENNGLINCFQDTISLDASTSQGIGTLNYLWSTVNGNIITSFTNSQVSIDEPGSYSVRVEDSQNGCFEEMDYVVHADFVAPTIDIAEPDTLTCVVNMVTLDASSSQSNTQFEWSNNQGYTIQDPSTALPTVFEAGSYDLRLISNENGCDNQGSVFVQENVIAPTVNADTEGTLDCSNEIVSLVGTGSSEGNNFNYNWQGSGAITNHQNIIATTSQEGQYVLIITNLENGCIASDTTNVIADGFPILDIATSVQSPTCLDDYAGEITIDSVIGGSEPFVYSFNNSLFSLYNYRNYLTQGTYTIQIEDADGCEFETTIVLSSNPETLIELGDDLEIEIGDSTTINLQLSTDLAAIDTIIWQPLLDTMCLNCTTQTFTPTETMNIQVEVIDTFGCSQMDNLNIYVLGSDLPQIYIPSAFSPNSNSGNHLLNVFAKPNVEKIQLFQVFDRWGEMVWEAKEFDPASPSAAWNGMHGGNVLNSQVFVWRVEYRLRSTGEVKVEWGDVTLFR